MCNARENTEGGMKMENNGVLSLVVEKDGENLGIQAIFYGKLLNETGYDEQIRFSGRVGHDFSSNKELIQKFLKMFMEDMMSVGVCVLTTNDCNIHELEAEVLANVVRIEEVFDKHGISHDDIVEALRKLIEKKNLKVPGFPYASHTGLAKGIWECYRALEGL